MFIHGGLEETRIWAYDQAVTGGSQKLNMKSVMICSTHQV
jgi:hypothetical protein